MKKISLLKLFLIFVKVGAILLGGGYVILPILTNELIEKRNLIEHDDLIDYFALSQSLPGIIAANISMFVGYKLRGARGAIVAMFGIIFIPFLTIILLASIINALTDNQYVQNIFWGISIAIIALIMWQKCEKNIFFYSIFALALVSFTYFNFSPIKTILIFLVFGILLKKIQTLKEAE